MSTSIAPTVTTLCLALVSVALTATSPARADGTVSVAFQDPEQFTDVNERQFKTTPDKNQNLQQLKSWLEKRAGKMLTADQQLSVTFLDIDLAGAFEPWQSPSLQDVRVVKDIYPPRLKLRFQLKRADGSLISEGERELRDLGYLMKAGSIGSDSLAHEKALLDSWLRKEFPAATR